MCDPIVAPLAVMGLAGLQAYGQVQQGKQMQAAANANAQAQNAAARDAVNVGNSHAEQQRQQIRQLNGLQTASLGAAGTDMSSGSALNLFSDTARAGAFDIQTALTQSLNQRNALHYQADMSRMQGKIDRQNATMTAANTLLTAPLKAYGAYKTVGGEGDVWKWFKAR